MPGIGQGAAPKPAGQRRRRNADPFPQRKVEDDGELRGPELPEDIEWHPRTMAWWDTWRRSPQAQQFTATDWSFLLDTALMHHTMWLKEKWEFAAELRLRAAKLGATVEDRLRLRLTIETPGDAKRPVDGASVADIASRRARLMG